MLTTDRWFRKICAGLFCVLSLAGCGGGSSSGDGNLAPLADAGYDLVVTLLGAPVPLDGTASIDPDGDLIEYQWQLISVPSGSSAFIQDAGSATASLVALDFEGSYVVSLVVDDGLTASVVDTKTITLVPQVQNIILMVGDGMGFEQVRAAGLYRNGAEGSLSFEQFPSQGYVTTLNADDAVTDSAAAATAMATGGKVDNGVISQRIPGDGSELETILEIATWRAAGTALVTTTTISHATPAAFAAHEPSRNNYEEIIADYLNASRPDILFGGAQFISPATAEAAGYTVVADYDGLVSLDTDSETMVWGQFGETQMPYEWDGVGDFPHLSESVVTALDILDNDPDGFFMLVEGGRIDHAGHANDIQRNIFETVEFANAAQNIIDWAAGRTDTLVTVTADHETGGLQVLSGNGQGVLPEVSWTTTGHTARTVPVYAWGVNAHLLNGGIDNTDIYAVMTLNWH